MATQCGARDITVEDPTDDLRRLRDYVDVRRMQQGPLAQLAQTALESAAAATSDAAAQLALKLPNDVVETHRRGLQVSTQQLQRAWEALLFIQPLAHDNMRCAAGLKRLARQRLYTENFASTKQRSAGKVVMSTPGDGFVMYKAIRGAAKGNAAVEAAAAALQPTGEVEMSPAEREAKMKELWEGSLEWMEKIKARIAAEAS